MTRMIGMNKGILYIYIDGFYFDSNHDLTGADNIED